MLKLTLFQVALREGIASVSTETGAHRCVTDHATLGVGSTRAWTGVPTLSIDAGQITGALAVAHAFWSTIRRGANEIGQTGAGRLIVDGLEDGIGAALAGLAGILGWHSYSWSNQRGQQMYLANL